MELEQEFDLCEFKKELFFINGNYARLFFEYGVTHKQYNSIIDLMKEYSSKIKYAESIDYTSFEQRIYEIVPKHDGNYRFAEAIARQNHRLGRWKEVFETLYGDMPKFQSYLKNN